MKLFMSIKINIQNLTTMSFGKKGGDSFKMVGLKSLQLRSGTYVDAIIINGQQHGGNGGTLSKIINFSEDECIVRIEIRSGKYIDNLEITTNKGQCIKGGGNGGNLSEVSGKMIALAGRSGTYLDHIDILGDFS